MRRPSASSPSGSDRPRGVFDLPAKERRLAALDAAASEAGFWDDQRGASRILREAEALRTDTALWRDLLAQADDLLAAIELLEHDADAELAAEVERDAAALSRRFEVERTALLFAGEYDGHGAILSINAGAGGTEATDWAAMLSRMYLRWAERHRYKTSIVEATEGEETGYRSLTIEVDGRSAYGWLSAEKGVHRLVRISPFDSQNRRHTTFALIEVLPLVEEDEAEIELDLDELRIETYRSQGAGGQNVQKTETAVRVTHLPTGLVAQSQNERSQQQNKDMAMRVLRARLLERRLAEREEELRELRGEHIEAGWGNQIRSYVLHPYQMVKDLRTGHETANTAAVLDGDLDPLMTAELERRVGQGGAGTG